MARSVLVALLLLAASPLGLLSGVSAVAQDAGVRSAIDRHLDDPEVDILLALGVLASNEAAQRTNLPKPVIAPVVLDPDLQSLHSIEGTSGVRNLNYVAIPQTFEEDFRAFMEIAPVRRMVVLMSEPIIESIPALSGPIAESAAEIGLEITVISVGSAEEALASLPEGTDGVLTLGFVPVLYSLFFGISFKNYQPEG